MQSEIVESRTDEIKPSEENGFVYEFTTDKNLLNQYYEIREACYKKDWGLKVFSGVEDSHDRHGDILIVREGEKVVGGGRVVFRYSNSPENRLPLETEDFLLHELLPEIGSERIMIGEIGRIAVSHEYRGGKLSKIGLYLFAKAQSYACRYLTMVTPVRQALTYRKLGKRLGADIRIIENVPVAEHPYHNNIEMKLLVCDLATAPDVQHILK